MGKPKKQLKHEAAEEPPSEPSEESRTKLSRHIEFLRKYLGRPHDSFTKLRLYKTIGLSWDAKKRVASAPKHRYHRFAVLSVEGDCLFEPLEVSARLLVDGQSLREWMHQSSPQSAASLPNATMCCLHYGNGTPDFPFMSYRVILAQNTIVEGEPIRLCALSVLRCDDEIRFYAQLASTVDAPATPMEVSRLWARRAVENWPAGLGYYHGIGARHLAADATVSFPANLLRLQPCPSIGADQLQVVAAEYLHEGTCFLYGGAARETFVSAGKRSRDSAASATHLAQHPGESLAVSEDEVYNIYLSTMRTCVGQNITRFINHRYHMGGFGNVVLVNVMIPVARDDEDIALSLSGSPVSAGPQQTQSTIIKDRNTVFLNIPFFITKTPIYPGTQLVTTSYGPEYDAKLERSAVTRMSWVPFSCAAHVGSGASPLTRAGVSAAYAGTYLASLDVGCVVWRPCGASTAPWLDMFVVQQLLPCAVVLRRLVQFERDVTHTTMEDGTELITVPKITMKEGTVAGRGPRCLCSRREVVWLLEGVDFDEVQQGGLTLLRMWRSWVVESSSLVYAHMGTHEHWFGPLVALDGDVMS